jgi:hypothetical protein
MALVDGLSFAQNVDIATGVATDTSNYGVGGNPLRSDKANYLLWSKTNSSGVRSFDNPDQGNVLSTLVYTVNTPIDGYYEGILCRFGLYDNGANYVEQQQTGNVITQYASIVYSGGSIYKCIAPVIGVTPPDSNYWEVVTDLSTLLDNTNVDVSIEQFYISVRSRICAGQQFKSKCGCGCNGDLDQIRIPLLITSKLIAADAEFANGNFTEMESIIREITLTCSNC